MGVIGPDGLQKRDTPNQPTATRIRMNEQQLLDECPPVRDDNAHFAAPVFAAVGLLPSLDNSALYEALGGSLEEESKCGRRLRQ